MRNKIHLASVIGSVLAIVVVTGRFADMDLSGKSPLVTALMCLLFCLICMNIGADLLFPPSQPKRRLSLRLALHKRRIGGFTTTREECLRIDQEGIFETRLGLIAWPQILGLSTQILVVNNVQLPLLRIYLRDPWRYLDNGSSALLVYGYRLQLARDARHGRIDIATQAYRVDAETACEIARALREDCAEPWIEEWNAATSSAVIEQRLREFELLAAARVEALPALAQPTHAALPTASQHRSTSS